MPYRLFVENRRVRDRVSALDALTGNWRAGCRRGQRARSAEGGVSTEWLLGSRQTFPALQVDGTRAAALHANWVGRPHLSV